MTEQEVLFEYSRFNKGILNTYWDFSHVYPERKRLIEFLPIEDLKRYNIMSTGKSVFVERKSFRIAEKSKYDILMKPSLTVPGSNFILCPPTGDCFNVIEFREYPKHKIMEIWNAELSGSPKNSFLVFGIIKDNNESNTPTNIQDTP